MLAFNFNNERSATRNLISEDRNQKPDDRIQIADAANQITWIVHSHDPFDPSAPSIE